MLEISPSYLWRMPEDYPQSRIGRYDRGHGPDRFMFMQGCPIASPKTNPKVAFGCSKNRLAEFDCIWADAGSPIIGEKLRGILADKASEWVQFFDVDISANDGALNSFWMLNVAACVEVIDVEKSRCTLVPGTNEIMSFSELVIDENEMVGAQIGREKSYLSYIFVSRALALTIDKADLTGIDLVVPSLVV